MPPKRRPATYEEKMRRGYKNLTGISRSEADKRNEEAKKHKKGTSQIYRENRDWGAKEKAFDKKFEAWLKLQKPTKLSPGAKVIKPVLRKSTKVKVHREPYDVDKYEIRYPNLKRKT